MTTTKAEDGKEVDPELIRVRLVLVTSQLSSEKSSNPSTDHNLFDLNWKCYGSMVARQDDGLHSKFKVFARFTGKPIEVEGVPNLESRLICPCIGRFLLSLTRPAPMS